MTVKKLPKPWRLVLTTPTAPVHREYGSKRAAYRAVRNEAERVADGLSRVVRIDVQQWDTAAGGWALHETVWSQTAAAPQTNSSNAPLPRARLALDTADALNGLDLADAAARTMLATRLRAAGITNTMHAEHLRSDTPRRNVHPGMSPAKSLNAAEHNLSVLLAGTLMMETWSLDMRIEYELGQVLAILERPLFGGGLSEAVLVRLRTQLLELVAEQQK